MLPGTSPQLLQERSVSAVSSGRARSSRLARDGLTAHEEEKEQKIKRDRSCSDRSRMQKEVAIRTKYYNIKNRNTEDVKQYWDEDKHNKATRPHRGGAPGPQESLTSFASGNSIEGGDQDNLQNRDQDVSEP